jgi:hypothetical protein
MKLKIIEFCSINVKTEQRDNDNGIDLTYKGGEKMKHRIMLLSILIMTFLISALIIFTNISAIGGSAAELGGARPILKVVTTSPRQTHIDGDAIDTWLYVTNPSQSMDRLMLLPDPPYTEILHTVTINYLKIDSVDPDGTQFSDTYYPPEGEPQDWDDYRWDAIVNPRETSLVFYLGWQWPSGSVPGIAHMTYLLNCEYEGFEYDLVYKFQVVVKP